MYYNHSDDTLILTVATHMYAIFGNDIRHYHLNSLVVVVAVRLSVNVHFNLGLSLRDS